MNICIKHNHTYGWVGIHILFGIKLFFGDTASKLLALWTAAIFHDFASLILHTFWIFSMESKYCIPDKISYQPINQPE